MKLLNKSTIKQMLVISFTLLLVTSSIVIFYQMYTLTKVKNLVQTMFDHPLTVTQETGSAYAGLIKIHRLMKDLSTTSDKYQISQLIQQINDEEQKVLIALRKINKQILGAEGKQLTQKTTQLFIDWKPIRDQVVSLTLSEEKQRAYEITKNKGANHVLQLEGKFENLIDYADNKAKSFVANANTTVHQTILLASMLTFFFFVSASMIAIFLTKRLFSHLRLLQKNMDEIATSNDLTRRSKMDTHCELGAMAQSFDSMLDKVSSAIHQAVSLINSLEYATQSFSKDVNHIGHSTNQQHNEIEYISLAVNEMKETFSEVDDSARQIMNAAKDASTISIESTKTVEDLLSSIVLLSRSSETTSLKVADLVKHVNNINSILVVIREIADQTNLLALNAAIEAARAGEQGRGFSVVADEVRTLAARTQDSTTKIQTLLEHLQIGTTEVVAAIEESTDSVNVNVKKANEVGDKIFEISTNVENISTHNTSMSSAIENQEKSIQHLNERILAISNIAKETTEDSLKLLATNDSLLKGTESLSNAMSVFKIRI